MFSLTLFFEFDRARASIRMSEKMVLEEQAIANKKEILDLQQKLLESERLRSQVEEEATASLERFTSERAQARQALEAAREHLNDLAGAQEAAVTVEKRLQEQNEELTKRCQSAEHEAEVCKGKLLELIQLTSAKVEAGLEAVAQGARTAQKLGEARYDKLRTRLLRRDEELKSLRNVWRTLLVAHPDLDLAQEAAVEECKVHSLYLCI